MHSTICDKLDCSYFEKNMPPTAIRVCPNRIFSLFLKRLRSVRYDDLDKKKDVYNHVKGANPCHLLRGILIKLANKDKAVFGLKSIFIQIKHLRDTKWICNSLIQSTYIMTGEAYWRMALLKKRTTTCHRPFLSCLLYLRFTSDIQRK